VVYQLIIFMCLLYMVPAGIINYNFIHEDDILSQSFYAPSLDPNFKDTPSGNDLEYFGKCIY